MSDKPTPINVSVVLGFTKLAKFVPNWASSVAFDKSKRIGRIKLRLEMRRADGVMGRFGGGWNWKLGIQIGGKTLLISLLVAELTISIVAKEKK